MRFLYAKLTGYIGIYNGLGLSSIDIDFSKAKNKVCVISGPNGVGKSTLLNALNVMPDGNENFVPSMPASKQLCITNGNNLYEIFITHPLDKNGNRVVSKASFKKDGAELNPNGNISSYKDIVQSEFELDSNYTILSKVSSGNRGLADKKPAERKKIMSSLISSLEVYNDIYKNLNKKANIYKSYLNNVSSKIQNIGDETYLRSTKEALDGKLKSLSELIDSYKEQITECRTLVSIVDKDGSKQKRYEELSNTLESMKQDSDNAYMKLSKALGKSDSIHLEFLDKDIEDNKAILESHKTELSKIEIIQTNILSNMSDLSKEIDQINVQLNGLESPDESIKTNMDKYTSDMDSISKKLSDIGITDIDSTSKEEVEYVINYLIKLIDQIDIFYENMQDGDFKYIIDKNNYEQKIIQYQEELITMRSNLDSLQRDLKVAEKINMRPNKCKIDDCPFIRDSIMVGKPKDISNKISKVEADISNYQSSIEKFKRYVCERGYLATITDGLESNREILKKFTITTQLTNLNRFMELISHQYRFNEFRNLTKYLSIANEIITYKQDKSVLDKLSSAYIIQENNKSIRNTYESSLKEKTDKYNGEQIELDKLRKSIQFEKSLCDSINTKVSSLEEIKGYYDIYNTNKTLYDNSYKESESIKVQFSDALKELEKIDNIQKDINSTAIQITEVQNQLRGIDSQISLLESFQKDYNTYKEKYTYIDTLRKYSSPTQGSIQSLFMSIYMDKTLSTVNSLLGMIFNGQYKILQYVINEDEFRIPFIGNGMAVDDISNGSTSQVCIMGMIINLVLYTMGSNKFGIVSLDEIDSGLDQYNRYMFVDILQKICNILNIDQLFIISHSVESALDFVDVILLSDNSEYMDLFKNANIIYQYNK